MLVNDAVRIIIPRVIEFCEKNGIEYLCYPGYLNNSYVVTFKRMRYNVGDYRIRISSDSKCDEDLIIERLSRGFNLNLPRSPQNYPTIKNVIFNYPATIVLWSDGDKTVVKCGEDDKFDPEKGLAMAVAKKFLGTNETKSNFNDIFHKWLPDKVLINDLGDWIKTGLNETINAIKERYMKGNQ